jgi:RNA polymerase sigma-70 factor (sigma-E family)
MEPRQGQQTLSSRELSSREPRVTVIEPTVGGDAAAAFSRFYCQQFDRLARLAFVLVGDAVEAEDLVQETLTRVQPAFPGLNAPVAYARTVLMNLVKHRHARDARRRQAEAAATIPDAVNSSARELLDVIDALPERQKAVIVLRYYEDLSEAEIAAALGCRPGTVKSLAVRALARLRKDIES